MAHHKLVCFLNVKLNHSLPYNINNLSRWSGKRLLPVFTCSSTLLVDLVFIICNFFGHAFTGLLIFRGKKKKNFAGFSGANSRKNRPISREKSQSSRNNRPISGDFRGRKVKIRRKINFRRTFRGKFLGKSADFTENFGGRLRQEKIS